jgi:hypothetical protein
MVMAKVIQVERKAAVVAQREQLSTSGEHDGFP